jgi:hypothetical protein
MGAIKNQMMIKEINLSDNDISNVGVKYLGRV